MNYPVADPIGEALLGLPTGAEREALNRTLLENIAKITDAYSQIAEQVTYRFLYTVNKKP